MKYYRVSVKCGHVGRNHKYIQIDFYTAIQYNITRKISFDYFDIYNYIYMYDTIVIGR